MYRENKGPQSREDILLKEDQDGIFTHSHKNRVVKTNFFPYSTDAKTGK